MTERLYYVCDAVEGRARVMGCREEPEGRYAVELDRTLFHPQGGGQPADSGRLAGMVVENVIQRDDRILHIVAQPPAMEEVELHIHAERRDLNSRWHTAGHLIGYAGELYGWRPVKAHHWPGEGRVTFRAEGYSAVPAAQALIEKIEEWQARGLQRHIEFEDDKRKVRFGNLAAYLCGGTHVKSLAETGRINIISIKSKKGELSIRYALS